MNTKKKLLSLLLAAVMVLSLLPTAFAEGDVAPQAANGGTKRTETLDLSAKDTDDASTEEGWSWKADTRTLTLSGAKIEARAEAAVKLPAGATIVTAENTKNTITSTYSDPTGKGVLAEGAVTIKGSGELTVNGQGAGLYAGGSIAINAPITASCEGSYAIIAKGSITIDESSLQVAEPADGSPTSPGGEMWGFAANKVVIGKKTGGDPTAPTAPVFNDGLGNAVTDTSKYVKDSFKNAKGYTFAGWFDEQGKELTDVSKAVAGTAYTAKWTKDGKTVRTEVLDLSNQSTDTANTDEGWSWDASTKMLTLSGAMFDVHQNGALAAIELPDGATVTTVKGTKNVVKNDSEIIDEVFGSFNGGGIVSKGALTINGEGDLSVVGGCFGVSASGDLNIKAPISVTCTETDLHVYAIVVYDGDYNNPATGRTIKIDSSLRIKTPANGKIVAADFSEAGDESIRVIFVAKSDGNPADREVVIGKASNSYYYYGGSTTTSNTPGKSPKTADAGIALYAGMAVASLLGSGVVFSRKRKIF